MQGRRKRFTMLQRVRESPSLWALRQIGHWLLPQLHCGCRGDIRNRNMLRVDLGCWARMKVTEQTKLRTDQRCWAGSEKKCMIAEEGLEEPGHWAKEYQNKLMCVFLSSANPVESYPLTFILISYPLDTSDTLLHRYSNTWVFSE